MPDAAGPRAQPAPAGGLNPGRVFGIRPPLDELVRRWAAQLRPADRTGMDARQIELLNQMLPTRLFVSQP
jgi:hypothetical protein